MLKEYDNHTPKEIIARCKFLGANQVTFRKIYYELDKDGFIINDEGEWVKENACKDETISAIKKYITGENAYIGTERMFPKKAGNGEFLYTLPFGAKVYSINGMSVVIDDDCMSKGNNESLKYVILRENSKLYCRWDDEGSLIF